MMLMFPFVFRNPTKRKQAVRHTQTHCNLLCTAVYSIDLLNFVFLRDCPSLASQGSNFHITCGTFPAFLCFPASLEIRNANRTTTPGRFVHTIRYYAVGSHARPAQINPAIYGPAAQRSAVRSRAEPCGAVPCPSLGCCVAALCAFFRT